MADRSIRLSSREAFFVRERIERGSYKNANEVVSAGLRLLEEREAEEERKLERLRIEVQKGMDDLAAGRYVEITSEGELDEFFEGIRSEAVKNLGEERGNDSSAETQ